MKVDADKKEHMMLRKKALKEKLKASLMRIGTPAGPSIYGRTVSW
jgi:hypothetical protein